jgi:hypothetical protein
MSSKCPACPVAEGTCCLATTHPDHFGYFCEWAGERVALRLKVIVNRAAIGAGPISKASKPRVALGTRAKPGGD